MPASKGKTKAQVAAIKAKMGGEKGTQWKKVPDWYNKPLPKDDDEKQVERFKKFISTTSKKLRGR
jgi:hypothetical protein